MSIFTRPSVDAAGAQLIGHAYAKGKTQNAVLLAGGGGSSAVDLVTAGFKELTLLARMTAGAAADLVVTVNPYEDDGVTVSPRGIVGQVNSPTLTGGVTYGFSLYADLGGIDKVRVTLTNNNAGAQTATGVYYLQK